MDPFFRLTRLMDRWRRRPPSRLAIIAIVVAFVASIALVTIERTVGWPDWLTTDRSRVRVPMR